MTNITVKGLLSRWIWLVGAIFLSLPFSAKATENFSSSELDTLVATIALYPDPLLAHVLTASTYGDQIPGASEWAQEHKSLKGEELAKEMETAELSYDPSVQALIPFPTVLATMAKYRTWSDQLGDAVASQKDQVMDAVQRMRNTAYNLGQLKSDDQVTVSKNEAVVIEPVRAEYVYVPVYNPRVVFYVYADGYSAVRYPYWAWIGSWYGEWGWGSCWFEWEHHHMFIRDHRWYHHRSIPRYPRRYIPSPRKDRPSSVQPSGMSSTGKKTGEGKLFSSAKKIEEKVSAWKNVIPQQSTPRKEPGLHKNKDASSAPQGSSRYSTQDEVYYPEAAKPSYPNTTINASSNGGVKRRPETRDDDRYYEKRGNVGDSGNGGFKKSKRKTR